MHDDARCRLTGSALDSPVPTEPCLLTAANIARLAAEQGLPVEEVAKRAGLRPNALSPVPSGFSIRALAEVATVLGVELGDPVPPHPDRP